MILMREFNLDISSLNSHILSNQLIKFNSEIMSFRELCYPLELWLEWLKLRDFSQSRAYKIISNPH